MTSTEEFRTALGAIDWEALHAEGKTTGHVDPGWFASEERCEVLRRLCAKYNATRVLEVGASCGLASLAMASALPDDGSVVGLEIDPYLEEVGKPFLAKTGQGKKIQYVIGPAMESLRVIARSCFEGASKPFDFLLIDADRAGMMEYFNLLWWESPNLLADNATVCIDVTPYKGQAPVLRRGPSGGHLAGDLWVVPSGQEQIDSVRRTLEASEEHTVYSVAGLLVSHRRDPKGQDEVQSTVSTPRRVHPGGPWHGKTTPSTSPSLTHGANPLASFPNDHFKVAGVPKWVAPQSTGPVAQLRKAVMETDWDELYAEAKTMTRVETGWCGTEEQTALLRRIVSSSHATSILEIGGFCGISTLSMAEELPATGRIVSLEIDPYLVEFSEKVRSSCEAGKKITCMVGPAMELLERLAEEAKGERVQPFDFVVIDADRSNVGNYFDRVWGSTGLLTQEATICIDLQPYKGQKPVRYVKSTPEAAQWIVPAGLDKVNELRHRLEGSSDFSVKKIGTLLLVKGCGVPELKL